MEAAQAGDEDLVHLVLSRPAQDHGLTCDGAEACVSRVIVGHGHERSLGAGDGVSGLGIWGIGENDPLAATHSKAGVSEPSHVHRDLDNTRNRTKTMGV